MKKKRKMPNHIVLPNGMWRFVKGKAKTTRVKTKRIKFKARKKSRSVYNMARRRKGRSYSKGSKMSRGIFPVHGMIASALIGAGASTLQEKFLPQMIPYQGEAIGFAVGGVGGAVGAFARNLAKGGNMGGSSGIY